MSPEAAPAAKCTACRASLPADALFCKRCGAPQPGAPACPHCGAIADTSRDDELVLKCNACGSPRVVVTERGIELSGREQEHLAEAKRAGQRRLAWWLGAVASTLGAVGVAGVTLIVSLLLGVSLVAAGIGLGVSVPFALLALLSFRRARQRTVDVGRAVDAAWRSAAKDVATQSPGGVTAERLARMLPLGAERSERLLAELAVDDMLSSEISAEGRLSFEPALRIDSAAPGPDLPPADAAEAEAAAEIEALGAAEGDPARARSSTD